MSCAGSCQYVLDMDDHLEGKPCCHSRQSLSSGQAAATRARPSPQSQTSCVQLQLPYPWGQVPGPYVDDTLRHSTSSDAPQQWVCNTLHLHLVKEANIFTTQPTPQSQTLCLQLWLPYLWGQVPGLYAGDMLQYTPSSAHAANVLHSGLQPRVGTSADRTPAISLY